MHHSSLHKDDPIMLGGSSEEEMERNLRFCEGGPLSKIVSDCCDNMSQQYQGTGKGLVYPV